MKVLKQHSKAIIGVVHMLAGMFLVTWTYLNQTLSHQYTAILSTLGTVFLFVGIGKIEALQAKKKAEQEDKLIDSIGND